jgi:hypothetical protein
LEKAELSFMSIEKPPDIRLRPWEARMKKDMIGGGWEGAGVDSEIAGAPRDVVCTAVASPEDRDLTPAVQRWGSRSCVV